MVSEEIRAMIPDYVRGLLLPGEAKEVESALDSSPEILPEFEAAQAYYAALNQIPEVKAPADFLDRVNRGIEVKPFRQRLRSLIFEPLYVKLPIELAGVAACLITVLVITHPFMPKERLLTRQEIPTVTHVPRAPAAPPAETVLPSPEEKREPAVAAPEQPAARPDFTGPPDLTPPRPRETPRETREIPREDQPAVAAAEVKKAEFKPAAMATTAMARKTAPSASAQPSIDAIPTLPAVAQINNNNNNSEETETVSDIGTIELTYIMPENGPAGQAQDEGERSRAASTIPTLASDAVTAILRTYDPDFVKTSENNKVTYVCKLPPRRLPMVVDDLGRVFTITTHLFPYDVAHTKLITVTFILQ
ncbi:MAG: hypothetical protein ABSF80_10360 [Chitinispirillaceae bacterium]|jgi:anti-sigma factor RsiW